MASHVNSPARSGVTFLTCKELEPASDTAKSAPGAGRGGFCGFEGSTWAGGLGMSPLLSYQRMTGTGRPVALQDSVTSPPSVTTVLAGGETITGLEPLPRRKDDKNKE